MQFVIPQTSDPVKRAVAYVGEVVFVEVDQLKDDDSPANIELPEGVNPSQVKVEFYGVASNGAASELPHGVIEPTEPLSFEEDETDPPSDLDKPETDEDEETDQAVDLLAHKDDSPL